MLKVGHTYTAKNGQRFLILAKKNRPASNGCSFIGENVKSGTIAYFNHKGEHAFAEAYNLKCDPFQWVGVVGAKLADTKFVPKEHLDVEFSYYLRMENNDPSTVILVTREAFALTYV